MKKRMAQEQRDQLILNYLPLAYRIAKKEQQAHGGPIDDLRQEAALALVKAVDHYDRERGRFATLVFAAVRNHFKNLSRRKKLVTVRLRSDQVDPKSLANVDADRAEGLRRVRATLAALCPRERRAVMLTLFAGKTLRQAGSAMRASYETVRRLVHLGIGRVAAELGVDPAKILGQFHRWRRKLP